MKNAKPIEAGCLAMIFGLTIDTCNNGKIVIVIDLVSESEILSPYSYNCRGCWKIDMPHPQLPDIRAAILSKNLIRIDDPDLQKEIEQEKQLVTTD